MKHFLLVAVFLKLSFILIAQTSKPIVNKSSIDSDAIKNWVRIGNNLAISNDGSYCMYDISNQPIGSKTLVLQSLANKRKKEFPLVDKGFFSQDSKQFFFQRKDTLFFYQLGTDNFTIIPSVKSYSQPKNILGKYIGYKLKGDNSELIVVNLLSGVKQHFDSVEDFSFSDNGNVLILKKKGQDNTTLEWVDLESGKISEIWQSGNSSLVVKNYSIDDGEKQVAFIVQKHNENEAIWYYKTGMEKATEKVSNKMIEDGLVLTASAPKFSEDGNYIFFNLGHPQKNKPAKIEVSLDVWSYKDTLIQGTQLFERPKSYDAVFYTQGNHITRLTHDYERIEAHTMKGDFVIVSYNDKGDRFWLRQNPKNFLVSLKSGERKLLPAVYRNAFWFSPNGTYLVYYDFNAKGNYFSCNLLTGKIKNISEHVTEPLNEINEFYKGKIRPFPVGIAGWVEKDGILVYDNYDIWKLDLTGKSNPVNLTNGYGRKHKTVFKLINEPSTVFSSKDTLLLTAFNLTSKFNGFFHKAISDSKSPEMLVMGPYTFFNMSARGDDNVSSGVKPLKALKSNVWIVNRQSFDEKRNYFYTTDFRNFKKLSNLSPQKNYNWVKAELHSWKQFDGTTGQGILYKPENFDPQKKYSVLINYYNQMSDRLYQFLEPSFTNHNINIPWFVSNGYLVFTPDIYFQSGRLNGQSAYNSIVSGAKYLQSLPFVDGMRMGINGHSTGGYYTNYLITHTNIFAAVVEGAGPSDVVSSYLQLSGVQGKERGTRLSSEDGYGATLWQRPDLYIESSPILKADKVTTPLIIFHSKDDTAVPWEQGVEFYLALRRLNKLVWMLQYDGQNHGNSDGRYGPYARDFTLRITQFFDHYLKGAPAPRWMTQGIPARLKGIESRFELDPFGNCGSSDKPCIICSAWNKQFKRNPSMFEKPLSEWKLDKDIQEELGKKQTEKYREKTKDEAQRIKETMKN